MTIQDHRHDYRTDPDYVAHAGHDGTAPDCPYCDPWQTDDAEADYMAYVAAQEADLTEALAAAKDAVHRASRALFELIELDAPGWTQTTEGDDATAALTDAARAIRAADRCAHIAVQ